MAAKKKQPEETAEPITSLLMSTEEIACAHMSIEFDVVHAATALGWSVQQVEQTLAQPNVKQYLEDYRKETIRELARNKVRTMKKYGVTRSAVEERLMALAMTDPSETKGSIEGQVRACKELGEMLGLKGTSEEDKLREKTPEELREIVNKVNKKFDPPKTVN